MLWVASYPDTTSHKARDGSNVLVMRYEEGNVRGVVGRMMRPGGDGFLDLGRDGVMRSIARGGSVIGWRQLDPDQIASILASRPPERTILIPRSADGRHVTDIDQLLSTPIVRSMGRTKAVRDEPVMEWTKGIRGEEATQHVTLGQ